MISTRARTRSGPLLLRGKKHGFGVLAVFIDFENLALGFQGRRVVFCNPGAAYFLRA